MTDFDNLITSSTVEEFGALYALMGMLFGDGTPIVEDQLQEEIRIMEEFHNRCFDL